MTPMEMLSVSLGIGAPCLTGVVWAMRQEGRINAHDDKFEAKEKLDDERHIELTRRLIRIENKLDDGRNT